MINKRFERFEAVGAKRVFLQPQLLRHIDSLIQFFFFFDNATIILTICKHFMTGNGLVCSWEMTVSTRNNYYIRPHLDARWFSYTGVLPPPQVRLK